MLKYFAVLQKIKSFDVSISRAIIMYMGADKSLARPNWKNNWKVAIFRPKWRSLLPGDLVGRTSFWIVFEWLAKVRVWSL